MSVSQDTRGNEIGELGSQGGDRSGVGDFSENYPEGHAHTHSISNARSTDSHAADPSRLFDGRWWCALGPGQGTVDGKGRRQWRR